MMSLLDFADADVNSDQHKQQAGKGDDVVCVFHVSLLVNVVKLLRSLPECQRPVKLFFRGL
jgi:hypothetical protein